jgi:hypothetical protein
MTDFPSDAARNDQTWAGADDDAFAGLEKEMAAVKSATAGLSLENRVREPPSPSLSASDS